MSNKYIFQKFGYLNTPFGLGIGRYVCQLQRVTLKFCKNQGGSLGVRKFIENDLINYAKENSGVVIYVKPRRHRNPVIKAEYLNGDVHWMCVTNYTREDIVQWMELLRTQYHDGPAYRLIKLWHTEFPSIQGPWTPFTFKEPSLNLTKFPNKNIGRAVQFKPTATEELIRLFKEQQESEKLQEEYDEAQKNNG
ncbi:mitochondrial ribosomal protein L43 [Megachile rotundata]|uniref:mitochondrial ribosomal protein L43 n=1 Tax=Megachile rotundata TaxID=143995 RepID=UPI000258F7AF|nr:PREDICTED: 39S ribosomal protein L43, mitochondrial [Megachile rotundata]